MADLEQVRRWIRSDPAGNIALRLPDGVIGIDLDLYDDPSKDHPAAERQAAWRELEARFGQLPESPRATSRDDGISGICLYRVPAGWKAAGILPAAPVCQGHPLPDGRETTPGDLVSPGEVIQPHHRYMVAPPSVHPSGRPYRWIGGGLLPVGDLPPLEVTSWLAALAESRPIPQTVPGGSGMGLFADHGRQSGRVGDDFNERADWASILRPLGAVLHHESGGVRYWTRPGKDRRAGHSATTGYAGDADRLKVFTPHWPPFTDGEVYTKFGAYALLNHGGDHQAAARELSRTGYGRQRPAPSGPAGDDEVPWPSDPVPPRGESAPLTEKKEEPRARRIVLTRASEIEPEPVTWAWEDQGEGRMPAGSLGLAAGREGTGKSSFAIWLTAQVTRRMLPGSLARRGVIYVAVEDSWKFTIVPRLVAAGADLDRVYRAEVRTAGDDTVSLSLPADNKELEAVIGQNAIAMVVLDPLMSAISDTLDTHVNRQVRQALDPLARMADRTGAVVLGIAHFNKSAGTDASSLITASGAFKDVARYIFAFATDPEDDTQVITQTKNSLGRSNLPSLVYRIISATVPTKKGNADVGRFVFDGESDRSVHDILASYGSTADTAEKTRAEDFLRTALAGGPRRTKEVEEEAKEIHGIAKRTLERARGKLRIAAAQRPTGEPRNKDGPRAIEWWIALPEHEGDLADAGPGRQHASASQGAAVWRSGGLADDQAANGRRPAHHHDPPASTDSQTASPPTPQEAGGLHQQPDGGERANVRKFSDSGQPPKADRWPEGSVGADANPAA